MRRLVHRSRADRGAAVVEYALIAAVIGIGVVGALTELGQDSGDELSARGDHIGMPDDGGLAGSATTTTAPAPTTTTTAAPGTAARVSAMTTSVAKSPNEKRWAATVTVSVAGPDGTPIGGAVVTGTWTMTGVTPKASSTTSCTTNGAGQCPVTRDQLDKHDATATFTLTNISGTSLTWSPGGDTPSSATMDQPPGLKDP